MADHSHDHPHDHLVRAVFGRPEHAAAELRFVLPSALSERLDLSTLTLVSGSFVDEELRDRETDLLFTASRRDRRGDALVYLLLEHQSSFDPWMPLRLLEYQLRIWGRWRRDHPGARLLPLIVPVVLYHGDRAWPGSTRFADLVEKWDDEVASAAVAAGGARRGPDADGELGCGNGGLTVDFRFLLDDLSRYSDAELRERAMDAVSTVTLLALRFGGGAADLPTLLLSWIGLLREAAQVPDGRAMVFLVMRYLASVSEYLEPGFLRDVLLPKLDQEVPDMGMTLLEKLKAEGIEAGQVKARREILLRLLARRFGAVPSVVAQRIEVALPEALDGWTLRVIDAVSIEAVFTD